MTGRIQPIVYVGPAVLLTFVILYFPSIFGIWYSLYDVQYLLPGRFLGLGNYARLLADPALVGVLWRSAVFTSAAVALTVALALALASWINLLRGWFGMAVQLIVILPWIVSNVVAALLFRWVFVNDIGAGIYLLEQLGVSGFTPLTDPVSAMAILIAFACWRTLGFAVVLTLAGLKSIPGELHEAAAIDGANAWQRFLRITLPLLKTPLLIVIVVLTLSNLNNVETPLIITGGGPAGTTNILPLDIYNRAFATFDFGRAIALAIGMFIGNILLVMAYVRLVRWNV